MDETSLEEEKNPSKTWADLLKKLSGVPLSSGIYIFKDEKQKVLYVGKAKNLRNRLRSYFQKSAGLDDRKRAMVARVRDFSYIVTDTELEALALEANLIKQHRPNFNVIFRDDKNYPYLKLTVKEEWPRLEVVRRIVRDGSIYFGPFVPAGAMWETLAFVRRHFGIRPCRYKLDKVMRPCIQHQMGRCPAPCAGEKGGISHEQYIKAVEEVKLFLKGRKGDLVRELERRMYTLSQEQMYEEAAKVRDRLAAVSLALEKQKIVSPELGDVDVINVSRREAEAVIIVLFIRNGAMIGAKDFYLKDIEGVSGKELLSAFIEMFYSKEIIPPAEVLVPEMPDDSEAFEKWLSTKRGGRTQIIRAQKGKKRELLEMALKNADEAMRIRKALPETGALEELKARLPLQQKTKSVRPFSIGAFDISTIQGAQSVGAFIWWEETGFVKDNYRHVNMKSFAGRMDDYAMMEETVRRVLDGLNALPALILIDGGKGQLEAAQKALAGLARQDIPEAISVAKDPDRVFSPQLPEPLAIEDARPSSLLLKRIRDEVHRFAISFHRKLRGKGLFASPLESVKGIGRKRRLELLRHFGSVEAMREAPIEKLTEIRGVTPQLAEEIKKVLARPGSEL